MTDSEAKICLDCGSFNYIVNFSYTEYGTEIYSAYEDGSYDRDNEINETDNHQEEDPECADCGSQNLLDVSGLSDEEFNFLFHIPDGDIRVELAHKILNGSMEVSSDPLREDMVHTCPTCGRQFLCLEKEPLENEYTEKDCMFYRQDECELLESCVCSECGGSCTTRLLEKHEERKQKLIGGRRVRQT